MNYKIINSKTKYKRLGSYIHQVIEKNTDLKVPRLLGVTLDKKFIPSVANTVGVNMANYKIIRKNQLACKLMSVGRDEKIPVSILKEYDEALVSSAYFVFEPNDENVLLADYLMMWLSRSETDRWVGFISGGDVRGGISWDDFCELQIVVPSIQKQQEIVKEYNAVVNRLNLNETLNQKLEETAQALYKYWFVDFEFSNEKGKPYKSNDGEMVYNEELDKDIPEGWKNGRLNDLLRFTSNRIQVKELNKKTYISTDNMLQNKQGITEANSISTTKTVAKFEINNILISNIRPYLKKIWFAEFEGGCSNDILCFETLENISPYYTYFILEQDIFFEYVMQGAKGTKMPRGDKDWIMNYQVYLPNPFVLKRFESLVKDIKEYINIKKQENKSLINLMELLHSKMTKVEIEKEKVS